MQVWQIYGTQRYVAAPNKPIACMVFNVKRKLLIWVKRDQLQALMLAGFTLELCTDPPIVKVLSIKPKVTAVRSGSGQSIGGRCEKT